MNPEMLIAALTARPARMGAEGRGGKPTITSDMIAGALAGLSDGAMRLVEAKYMEEERSVPKLTTSLLSELVGDGDEMSIDLNLAACLAVQEMVAPRTCVVCNGRAEVTLEKRVHTCTACGGTGVRTYKDGERAESCGKDAVGWKKMEGKFRRAQSVLGRWEYQAFENIRRNLRDRDIEIDTWMDE